VFKKNIASEKERSVFGFVQPKGFAGLFQRLTRLLHSPVMIEERQFHFDEKVLALSKSYSYLKGYWQSERYFSGIRDILVKDLTISQPLSGANLEIAKRIQIGNSVSVHVRRGDYVTDPRTAQVHNVCGLDYYQRAMSLMTEKLKTPNFYVFSDDINWAKVNIGLKDNVVYVDNNTIENGHEDLRLMSLCAHNIIANSSLSWWGAWLNNNESKLVVAPKKWFATDDKSEQDIVPLNWLRI
jgi:hypothetical protein